MTQQNTGVRARQEKVAFVTCDDQELLDRVVRPLLNKTVALSAGSSVRGAAERLYSIVQTACCRGRVIR